MRLNIGGSHLTALILIMTLINLLLIALQIMMMSLLNKA